MRRTLVFVLSLTGCGRLGFDVVAGGDAGDGGVPADACAFGPWSTPVPVAELSSSSSEWGVWLSEDRLEIIFSSDRSGNYELYRATRTSASLPFDPPIVIALSGALDRDDPFLSADGLTMWFDATQASDTDIYVTTRAARGQPFAAPVPVTELNSTSTDETPALTADGLTMYFGSSRIATKDIFRATRATPTSTFGTPVLVPELSGGSDDSAPTLASDGTIYLASASFGASVPQIFTATPNGTGFDPPVVFDAASDTPGATELDPYITRDGRTFVFSSSRAGSFDLYMIERSCL
jgi:hypothetical protein